MLAVAASRLVSTHILLPSCGASHILQNRLRNSENGGGSETHHATKKHDLHLHLGFSLTVCQIMAQWFLTILTYLKFCLERFTIFFHPNVTWLPRPKDGNCFYPSSFNCRENIARSTGGGALLELFVWNVRKWTKDNGYVNWWLGLDKLFLDFGCFCGLGVLRRCPSEHVKTTPHTEPSCEDRCTVWFTAAIDLQRAAGSGSTLGPPCPSLGPLLGRSGTAALPSL